MLCGTLFCFAVSIISASSSGNILISVKMHTCRQKRFVRLFKIIDTNALVLAQNSREFWFQYFMCRILHPAMWRIWSGQWETHVVWRGALLYATWRSFDVNRVARGKRVLAAVHQHRTQRRVMLQNTHRNKKHVSKSSKRHMPLQIKIQFDDLFWNIHKQGHVRFSFI